MTDSALPHDRLREARIGAGFQTAAAAARANGWQVGTYRHHENGQRNMPGDAAIAYAKAFGVSAGWLLGEQPQRNYAAELQLSMFTQREIDEAGKYSGMAQRGFHAAMIPYTNLSLLASGRPDDQFQTHFAIDDSVLTTAGVGRDATPMTFMAVFVDTETTGPGIERNAVLIVDRAAAAFKTQGAKVVYTYSGVAGAHTMFRHPDDTVELMHVGGIGDSVRVAASDLTIWGRIVWIGQPV